MDGPFKSLISMIKYNYFFDLTKFRGQVSNPSKNFVGYLGELKAGKIASEII